MSDKEDLIYPSDEELNAFTNKLYEIMESPPSPDYKDEISTIRYSDVQDKMGYEAFSAKYNTREKFLAEFGYKNLKKSE